MPSSPRLVAEHRLEARSVPDRVAVPSRPPGGRPGCRAPPAPSGPWVKSSTASVRFKSEMSTIAPRMRGDPPRRRRASPRPSHRPSAQCRPARRGIRCDRSSRRGKPRGRPPHLGRDHRGALESSSVWKSSSARAGQGAPAAHGSCRSRSISCRTKLKSKVAMPAFVCAMVSKEWARISELVASSALRSVTSLTVPTRPPRLAMRFRSTRAAAREPANDAVEQANERYAALEVAVRLDRVVELIEENIDEVFGVDGRRAIGPGSSSASPAADAEQFEEQRAPRHAARDTRFKSKTPKPPAACANSRKSRERMSSASRRLVSLDGWQGLRWRGGS